MKHIVPILLLLLTLSCEQRRIETPSDRAAIQDDLGKYVPIGDQPVRIVSLAPNITEILFALGLDREIVGVTEYCNVPAAALSKPKIGGLMNPNIERIVESNPDLVVMSTSGNMKSDYDKLSALGLRVFVSNPQSIEGIFKSIHDLGTLTGKKTIADSLVSSLQEKKRTVLKRFEHRRPRRVLFLLSLNPIVAVGEGAFLQELLELARGENIARGSSTPYPQLSREEIFNRKPEVLLATHDVSGSVDNILTAYPEWKSLPAVQSHNVVLLDADLVTRPGPRIIEALELLLEAIHGDGE
jgi:iron complex transport system substrate-binding protein